MRYPLRLILTGLAIVSGSMIGCSGESHDLPPNMQIDMKDKGRPVQHSLKIKKGIKTMPIEPAGPKAPPLGPKTSS